MVAAVIWCAYEYFSHICQGDEQAPFCVFSLIVGPKVPRAWSHQPQRTLSSLWAPLEGLRTGPWNGLHKVVGDLPLVLKQVFNLCTVCIACKGKKEHSYHWQRRAGMKMKKKEGVLSSPAWHPYMYALWPSYLHRHLMTLFIKSDSDISIEGFTSTCQKTQSYSTSVDNVSTDSMSQQQKSLTLWVAAAYFIIVTNAY